MAEYKNDSTKSISDSQPPNQFANVTPTTPMLDHSFTLQAILELKGSQGAVTQAISNLTDAINRQDKQLGKIDDLRVEVGKIDTNISNLTDRLGKAEGKLSEIKTWITGAGAIIAFIVVCLGIAAKFLPLQPTIPQNTVIQPALHSVPTIPNNTPTPKQ